MALMSAINFDSYYVIVENECHQWILSSNGRPIELGGINADIRIKSNAVSINKEKITENIQLTENDLLNGKYILAQKGKKNYFLIIVS